MQLSIEMNLDLTIVERSYYGILDCLSDIGGIIQVLHSGVICSLIILNYNNMENFMAASLFRMK